MKKLIVIAFVLALVATQLTTASSGCLLYETGTLKCQICSNNLQLDDLGNCKLYTPIEGCNVYSAAVNGAQCSTCAPGYLLSGGICLQVIANCVATTNVNSCDQCAVGYVLVGYSNCFSTNITNCSSGSLPRTVNGVSFCQKFIILSCTTLSLDGGSCTNCSQGYTAINGICFPVQSSIPCSGNSCLCQGYYFGNICYSVQLTNCLASADKIFCDLCGDLYYANNGFCLKFVKNDDINCNVLTADGSRCAGCNLNYFLNSDFICVKNFQLCPTSCTSCAYANFQLYNSNCYFSDPLCLVYNFQQQVCQRCQSGYVIDARTLSCVKEVTCLKRDGSNVCTSCFSGYQLNYMTVQCNKLPPNCVNMNTSTLLCLNCSPATVLNNNICVFSTPNCVQYDYFGYCQNCSNGYVQIQRVCLLIAQNCLISNPVDQSKCQNCMTGYHLSNQLCYINIEGCLSYTSQSLCSFCSSGYLLINSSCYFNDINCLAQDSNGLCLSCQNGFIPFKSKCVYFDPFCLSYDPNTMVCTQAMSYFSINSFTLQQQLTYLNFVMQASSASQSTSASDYNGGAIGGSYSKSGFILTLPYAGLSSLTIASYSLNGNVQSCQIGFTLSNAQCIVQTVNCASYNQYGLCQQCNPGYDFLSDNSCSLRSSKSCLQQSGGICTQAASGYVLIGGAAYFSGSNINQISADGRIVSAADGYFVYTAYNIAWPYDANCGQQNEPGVCLKCVSSLFSIINGRCVVKKLNCVAYSPYGICMGCSAGYFLWAGQCKASNCANLDINTGYCQTCAVNFTLQLGQCVQKRTVNCQVYNGLNCLYCSRGYYLTAANLCAKMINNCLIANAQTGRCTQCIVNYTLYQQQCIPQIINCQVYSASLNSCTTCATLYYPIINNTICGYLGFYCAALNDLNSCVTCNTGLTLINQKGINMCIRPISNCFEYDDKIKCIRCNSGYVLQYNKCKSIRCATFDFASSVCQACQSPYVLSNGSCIDSNCDNYTTGQKCLQCQPRYYLSNGICILSPDPNCASYNSNGVCLQCAINYTLNANGVCVQNDQLYYGCLKRQYPCTKCSIGYFLNGSLCYARRCSAYKSNRDCLTCINYYTFEPTQRFCILYTCSNPNCYESDAPPSGFYSDGSDGSLKISYCISYTGANCGQCQGYRYPNPSILYNLCYPYNCQTPNLLNCSSNCLANFISTATYSGVCLASNCLNWDLTGKCLQCADTYQLINGSYCLLVQISNCLVINYTAIACTVCAANYEIYNGNCRISNCASFSTNNPTLCLACINGFIFNPKDGTCQLGKCSVTTPNNNSRCLTCLLGYYLQGYICIANNCTIMDYPTLTCTQCNKGYDVVPGIGICKASNCNSFDNNLFCKSCSTGYGLRSGGICVAVDLNCAQFDVDGNCLGCKDTKAYINIADVCVYIVVGCVQYSKTGCIACSSSFTLTNGLCTVKYCSNYTIPDKCSICQNRYQLQSDGTCYPKNCLSFNKDTYSCLQCEPRFQLVGAFCFTYNCSIYQNYLCSQCQPGFTLVNQMCTFSNCPNGNQLTCAACLSGFNLVNGVCQVPQSSCATFDSQQFVCLTCAANYNLTALGTCVLVQQLDPYCVTYNPQTGTCTKCLPNFNFNPSSQQCQFAYCSQWSNSQPVRGRQCTGCASGFVLDSISKYCIPYYCKMYSLSAGTCTSCIGGASLTNNICFANKCANYNNQIPISPTCLSCAGGYQLNVNNLCQVTDCLTFNQDFSCATCQSGYAINSNGLCVSTQCNSGYTFQNFNCVPANCVNYNMTTGYCTQCLPGFVQQRYSCVADSCLKFNNQYLCQQCRPGYNIALVNGQYICNLNFTLTCPNGYYFINGTCTSIIISNCSISDSTGSRCLRCMDGYFLSDGVCYFLQGCKSLSFITGCFDCLAGFVLDGFLCVSLNCDVVNSDNTCASCIGGYSLIGGICRANIYQCLQTGSNGQCLQCSNSFLLTQGRCIAIGCSTYSLSTYICLTCQSNYILKGQICQLKAVLPNCFTALDDYTCSQCNNGYVQIGGKCYTQIQYCASYNQNNGLCSICSNGYYINVNYYCSLLPSYCMFANSNGLCTNCISGYFINNGLCSPNIPNCQSFDPNTALCLTCASGFYLTSNSQCSRLPQYCLTADRNGACLSCSQGYSIAGQICVITISNCYIYNPNNPIYCYQCNTGYYLNMVYGCTVLPPFCSVANNQGYCLNCYSGYQLYNQAICVLIVQNCISYIQVGNNSTHCTQCSQGFTLTDSYQCSLLPKNCYSADNAGNCLQCMNNYQLYSGLCMLAVQYCSVYNTSTYFCSGCMGGYYLFYSNNQYVCQQLPNFCLTADPSGNCLTCLNNYIVYNYRCVLADSILNCQSYNMKTYVCLACIQGYYLNPNTNICTLLPINCANVNAYGQCIACANNYILVGQTCALNILNCYSYNPNNGLCLQCMNGYALSSDSLTCSLVVVNCQVFSPTGNCLQCANGYYLVNNYCYSLPQGCNQLNNQQLCIGCLSQYTLYQNICLLTVANCLYYNQYGCSQCVSYYYLSSYKCYAFPSNCLSFDSSALRCFSCATGYTLNPSTYICSKSAFISNCLSYNSNSQCIACASRYFLRQNTCIAYINYCVNVDLAGNCLSCSFGSVLQNGVCVASSGRSLNCLSYDANTQLCLVCMSGYSFCQSSGICLLNDPNCQIFSSDGSSCVQCKSIYQLYQGKCLLYPTGLMVAPNGGLSCLSGYTLQNNSCFRSANSLTKLSQISGNFLFAYSSNAINSIPIIGGNTYWSPSHSQLNEYIAFTVVSNKPQIIFQLGVKGSQQSWVSGYIIQFKNRPDAPFICWNSCNQISGNSDGINISLLQLYHPIIATELRIYPVRWNNQISLQLQVWINPYQ